MIHDVAIVVAVPSEGPAVRVNGLAGCDSAELIWNQIPQHSRNGFITNYTIYYTSGTELHGVYLSHAVLSRLEFWCYQFYRLCWTAGQE